MKKTIQKLLSVILVVAICVSTLCGSIIGVNAAADSKLYSIVGSEIAAGTKVITMEVTLTDPTGMKNGKFDLMLGKDVIDDANFGTKVNDDGETVPDYDNYLSSANSFTLEEFLGTEVKTPTGEYTAWKDSGATGEYTTAPTGSDTTQWVKVSDTPTRYEYSAWSDSGTTGNYTTAPAGDDLTQWVKTSDTVAGYQYGAWTNTTTTGNYASAPAGDSTTQWVKQSETVASYQYGEWTDTGTTKWSKTNNGGSGTVVTSDITAHTNGLTVQTDGTIPAATDTVRWVNTGSTRNNGILRDVQYEYKEQTRTQTPLYTYVKQTRTATPLYTYKQQTRTVTATYYNFKEQTREPIYNITYKDGFDTDGNNMIANINTYEERDVTVPVYDEEGNQTGTTTVKQKVLIDSHKESVGNKGTLLPNVYDGKSGLWNTKIEITGGTRLDGTEFNVNDFVNDGYDSLAGTTTHAIAGEETDGRKYVYNMTDDYYESVTGKPVKHTQVTVTDGETTTTVNKYVNDINLLHSYYREYTTVDVATANLGYKISTVSEDSVGSMPAYSQYAQGFRDITFNTDEAYTSITFTVTLDFTGLCDRVSANQAVESGNETGIADDGVTSYRKNDGHYAAENYVGYGKKYEFNLLNATGDVDDLAAKNDNEVTCFSHVHDGHIDEKVGKADPSNIDAIKAAGLSKADNKTYFNLFDTRCSICGRITPMLASTNLAYKEYVRDEAGEIVRDENGNATIQRVPAGMLSFNNYRNLTGVNLTYQADGTVSLNIHFPNVLEDEKFIITDQNGKVLRYSDTVPSTEIKYTEIKDADEKDIGLKKASFYASVPRDDGTGAYDGLLLSSSRMITIDNLSAKDADTTLYIAKYTPKSSTEGELMGITHAISLAEYCRKVINEEDVYYFNSGDTYTESKIEGDKLVAAAFMNYANASKISLGTPAPEGDEVKIIPTEIDLLEFSDDLVANGSTSKYYDTNVADNGETGADWDNAIIIDSAEELVYLCKGSGNETKGKYYKVADNILGFNLATSALDINGSLADNIEIIKGSGKNHAGATPGFQGHFDGNGATVYGAWTNHNAPSAYAGLFTCVKGEVTIKNIHVNKAHFTATAAVGGIVGYHSADEKCTVTIENCSVTDSYFEVTTTGYNKGVGAIFGLGASAPALREANDKKDYNGDGDMTDTIYRDCPYIIKNCYVNLDEENFVSVNEGGSAEGDQVCHGGVMGVSGSNALAVSDCIVIGITPYATSISTNKTAVQHSGLEGHFSNVYTTSDVAITDVNISGALTGRNFTGKVIPLSDELLKGLTAADNMPKLNWDTVWCATEGYPTLYAPYNVPAPKPKTIYWDGSNTKTAPSEGSGTKDDPYIIRTVAEFAYISGQGLDNYAITDGKYYKIADGIESIVMQPEAYAADIMALGSAAEVKAYFEANKANMKTWLQYGWEGSTFCGNIDFNGATVYGIYQSVSTNAGLFSNLDAGAVISNLTIKNSYMQSNKNWVESKGVYDEYQVGAIGAVTNGSGYGKKATGFIWIKGCTVANNYMYNLATSHDRSGVIIGSSGDLVYIDDCFVYGNDATYGDGVNMSIWSNSNNSVLVSSAPTIPEGLEVVDDGDSTEPRYYNMVRNSIILGALPYDPAQQSGARFNDPRCFKSVYTDAEVTNVACASNTTFTSSLAQLAKVDANEITGLSAKNNMPNLNWYDIMTNPSGTWHYSYFSGMPTLEATNKSIVDELAGDYPQYAAAYNGIQFTPDTIGAGTEYLDDGSIKFGMYASGLNLKANPYITFTFAFTQEYRAVRDQMKITITTNKASYELPAMVAANGTEDVFFKKDGWTHNSGSGRYHLYRFTGISISELAGDMTITVYDPLRGETVELGKFSVSGYGQSLVEANKIMPCDYYTTRIEATKAFMFYINAVITRYGA